MKKSTNASMKTYSKGKSEMLGIMQWKHLANVKNVRKNAMKTSSKCKSEMLGRMQWKHLAKVSQKC